MIPEAFREDIERLHEYVSGGVSLTAQLAADRLLAALPPKAPTFTDEEALALYRALCPREPLNVGTVKWGHVYLDRLAAAVWVAPPALCPKPVVDLEAIKAKAGELADRRGVMHGVYALDVYAAIKTLYPQEATDG